MQHASDTHEGQCRTLCQMHRNHVEQPQQQQDISTAEFETPDMQALARPHATTYARLRCTLPIHTHTNTQTQTHTNTHTYTSVLHAQMSFVDQTVRYDILMHTHKHTHTHAQTNTHTHSHTYTTVLHAHVPFLDQICRCTSPMHTHKHTHIHNRLTNCPIHTRANTNT